MNTQIAVGALGFGIFGVGVEVCRNYGFESNC